ncbi:aryl-alcohol dehydrogenase-like predicted oxidoreductase [Allocatelliglobosispora scoriae]|uniref:Aryl-alcohol dehydrogenase-like predicted oxidoreductase n=1 Tax=Allocatelliglobosispora scoriae TaxID=643052 RepID=A0A841C2W4_9ACTN|nr:aryl-alcohol dehydrogenase-like predicted oxidoreductase [Allocatelliglobosispora scoriae]
MPFEVGLAAVRRLAPLAPAGATMAQFALRWIVDQPGATVVIPGARNASQAQGNAAVGDLAPLSPEAQSAITEVYDDLIRPLIHDRW